MDKVTYNLHVDSNEMLLIKLNRVALSAKDLGISTATLEISGSSLDDWIADVKAYLEVKSYKSEKKKLDMLENNEKEYSKNGLLTKETSISENNEDNISVIDSIVEYKYDEYGNMIGRIEKSGDQYGYYVNEYNNMGSLEKTTKLATDNVTVEESTTYTLDYLERIVHMKNEKHLDDTIITDESTYVYNKNGAKTKESSNGRELTYTYNDMNQVVKTSEKNESGTSVMSTTFEYATLTDYYKWTTKKNLSNILCEKTYKNNSTQTYKVTYTDASGHILREESNGLIVDNTYDNQNNY